MNRSIFKAYDIRGIYPTDINEQTVKIIGKACATLFKSGTVIIAHDIRYGSPELANVLKQTLLEESKSLKTTFNIIFVGYSTTPMFYFLVNHFKAVGGCMVTASHNPKNYNGIKTVLAGAEMVKGTDILNLIDTVNKK